MTRNVRRTKRSKQGGEGSNPELEEHVREAVLEQITEERVQVDLRELFRGAVKATLELTLEEVLKEVVGARKWERTQKRVDSYNGGYVRGLLTSMGHIEVRMPRARKGGAPVDVLGAYKRHTAEIDAAVSSAYVNGVSTRSMDEVVKALTGNGLSRSSVSRITRSLDEKIEELKNRKLTVAYPYLYLDATYFKARWARTVQSVPALIAYGVNAEGHRELLAVEIGAEESGPSYEGLLGRLLARGLSGVRLVISDAHEGILAAVRSLLPEVPHQRCVVHVLRNVGVYVPQRDGLRKRVLGQVSDIFACESLKQAKEKLEAFVKRWTKELPEAVKCLTDAFPAASRFFAFPGQHHARIRSTNNLERLNREIKRRIDAVDSFPDRASALRLITAIALGSAEAWGDRRYLDMSLLSN